MKQILITGASGFVGKHLINLLKNQYKIIGLVYKDLTEDQENVKYISGDILNKDFLVDLLNQYKPEAIIHLAGIAQTHDIPAEKLFETNFFGTFNLFESIVNLENSKSPKVIHISSSDVYGKTNNPENTDENSVLNPINHYGVSKLSGDRLAYQYSQSKKLNITIFRPFPHIGPEQRLGFIVPDISSQIVKLEKTNDNNLMVGNLDAVRDYLDVRDVCMAYKLALEKDSVPGEVYNLCSGNPIKISDLVNKLLSFSKKKFKLTTDPKRLRPSDIPISVGNNSKLKKDLGWKPTYNLDQTLEETLQYWRDTQTV